MSDHDPRGSALTENDDTVGDDTVADPVADAVAEAQAVVEADIADIAAIDIADIVAERDDYLNALRHLQADFENYKKRTLKQQTDHLERAAQALVEKLLPVLDAAQLAIAHGGGADVGEVVQVGHLLADTLAREGLVGIAPDPGAPFDPNEQEAVVHEPAEAGDPGFGNSGSDDPVDAGPEVVELLRAGYRWKGRLLRAAMVKVRG